MWRSDSEVAGWLSVDSMRLVAWEEAVKRGSEKKQICKKRLLGLDSWMYCIWEEWMDGRKGKVERAGGGRGKA